MKPTIFSLSPSFSLRSLLLLGLLTLAAACVEPPPDGEPPEPPLPSLDAAVLTALDAEITEQHELHQPPGIAAAVALPGVQPWIGSVGLSDLEDETPLLEDDRFKIASVTKTFVAATVLRHVDSGALDLDASLATYVDVHPRGDEMTLRQLLNHTAGVPDFSERLAWQQAGVREYTDSELAELVVDAPLLFDPGSSWDYSNSHYLYLGMVVTEVAGRPWQDEIADLASELGLDATRAPLSGEDWEDIVRGYIGDVDRTVSILPSMMSASGNMASNAEDLAVWGRAFWGGELFSESVAAEITEDPIFVGDSWEFGLSTVIDSSGEDTILFHNGSLNGYVSWVGFRPADQLSVSVLANAWLVGPLDYQYSLEIAEALFEAFDAAAP